MSANPLNSRRDRDRRDASVTAAATDPSASDPAATRPLGTDRTVAGAAPARSRLDRDPADGGRIDRDPVDRAVRGRDPHESDLRERDQHESDRRERDLRDRDVRDGQDLGVLDRATVIRREREAYGGVKIGSAFFGWLAATGTAALLAALVAAAGTAVGVLSGATAATDPNPAVVWTGVSGAVAVILVLFVAYYCGGYVAGRMARFNGIKQGLAVIVWGVLAVLVALGLGFLAGARWDAMAAVTGLPGLRVADATITGDGLFTALLGVAAAVVGAILGGLGGMRFHRRVDRAGLGR
jgi:hypothetical protein